MFNNTSIGTNNKTQHMFMFILGQTVLSSAFKYFCFLIHFDIKYYLERFLLNNPLEAIINLLVKMWYLFKSLISIYIYCIFHMWYEKPSAFATPKCSLLWLCVNICFFIVFGTIRMSGNIAACIKHRLWSNNNQCTAVFYEFRLFLLSLNVLVVLF